MGIFIAFLLMIMNFVALRNLYENYGRLKITMMIILGILEILEMKIKLEEEYYDEFDQPT